MPRRAEGRRYFMKRSLKTVCRRVTALLCLAALGVVGCGKAETPKDGTDSTPQSVMEADTGIQTTEKEETEAPLSEGERLALMYNGWVETPMDLGGRTIKIVSTSSRFIEEDRNTASNQKLEVLEAIDAIEKEYNCTIVVEKLKAKDLTSALLTAKSAGEAYCDILDIDVSSAYLEQIYANNLCMDLNAEPIADIIKCNENPWRDVSSMGQMFNKQLGVSYVANNSSDVIRACILFNKDLAEKYGYTDFYKMVKDGTWTYENFENICAGIAARSDGSVAPIVIGNKESLFIPPLIFANGGSTAEIINGKYTFTALNDKTMEALNYAVGLVSKGYVTQTTDNTMFEGGNGVFFFTIYNDLCKYTQGTVNVEFSVGLLPAPQGPSGNGKYNGTTYTEPLWSVVNGTEKPEEVAAVLVALANRTSRHDVYNYELMYSMQDEESADMFMLMYENMIPDYSRVISGARTAFVEANRSILRLEKTPKEAYEEMASEVQAIYDSIVLTEE